MKYRQIGNSELWVSPISLGGNIFGYALNEKQTKGLLDFSIDNGVNFIDTADVYSEGESERIIGKAVQGERDKWIIASKVGLHSNGIATGLGKKKDILKRIEKSLKRLGTDYIDLYQIHHYDPVTPMGEILGAFEKLIADGKIRYAGCSNYFIEELIKSRTYSKRNNISGYSSIQLHYNILKRDVEKEILPFCKRERIGVIVYGALGRGVLTNKYLYPENNDSSYKPRSTMSDLVRNDLKSIVLDTINNLNDYSKKYMGTSIQQLAISWVLKSDVISSVVLGIRTKQQMKENLNSINLCLNNKNCKEVDKIIGNLDNYRSISLGSFIA